MTEQRERGNVFGEAAQEYDALRPDYPAALIDDVLADAGAGPVLEVGAGTGKASMAFAAHGVDLVCLEPDARMAAVLAAKVGVGLATRVVAVEDGDGAGRVGADTAGADTAGAGRAGAGRVAVVVDRFESWKPDRSYGLLYSAQAWHWLDRARRNDLAWAALEPGGLLALFWNGFLVTDSILHAELLEVDRNVFPDGAQTTHAWSTDTFPTATVPFADEWAELELHDDKRFTDLRSRHYRRTRSYSAADYARYLATTSLYRLLEPAALDDALAAVRETIGRHGGSIQITVDSALATARRL